MSVPVPISRVFFVTAKENVSTGSGSIARILGCTQRGHDGDLFESSWRHKGHRYLCFEKNPSATYVITDMSVIRDDEQVPSGFTGIFLTEDTSKDKALKKHIVCVRTEPRHSASRAITDLQLINKSKGETPGPGFYTITNNVNDIQITFTVSTLSPPAHVSNPPTSSFGVQRQVEVPVRTSHGTDRSASQQNTTQPNAAPSSPVSAIDGVPFQLNPKFDVNTITHDPLMASLKLLTMEEISSQFDYAFSVEKDAVNKS